jgi:hypothetical protein
MPAYFTTHLVRFNSADYALLCPPLLLLIAQTNHTIKYLVMNIIIWLFIYDVPCESQVFHLI